MTKVMFVGDTHGNIDNFTKILHYAKENEVHQIIQVGDFGWWPRWEKGKYFIEQSNFMIKYLGLEPIIFIPGNHEDYFSIKDIYNVPELHKVADYIYLAGRGYIDTIGDTRLMFVGGACSIDKDIRTEGWDYFPEEEISQRDCYRLCSIASQQKIDILVSHDVIDGINLGIKLYDGFRSVRKALRSIAEIIRPLRVIHGHYHHRYFVLENFWGHVTRIDGLGHDNGWIHNQYIIENL
jgi:Icc-related predicted phosphoesterase